MKSLIDSDSLSVGEAATQVHVRQNYAADDKPAAEYQDALLLWLRWNEAQQGVMNKLFKCGNDAVAVEQTLDQLDQLRFEAVRISERLLNMSRFQMHSKTA